MNNVNLFIFFLEVTYNYGIMNIGEIMKVVISAGGTGGHIYPALAIINKIKEEEPNSEFLYIGTHDRMEKDIVPKYNIPFESIEIYGLSKNIIKDIKISFLFAKSIKKCKELIKKFDPDVVIGVGGYVTAPVLYAAHKLGYKTFIHEQNSVAGKANKFIANFVDRVGVTFPSSIDAFPKNKAIVTGNPCASNALKTAPIDKSVYGLSKDKKLVLIVMGSQGAAIANEAILGALSNFKDKKYEVLYVTGKNYYDKVDKNIIPLNVKVVPYIDDMTRIMKSVDVIVSRAGASTLSEILALNIPSILIPSPYVPNNHQYKNAEDLLKNNAAMMIEEKDLNTTTLINTIDELINDIDRQKQMKEALKRLAITDSASIIYDELKKLTKKG